MTEWHPIETAPKDGTNILVYKQFQRHLWLDHGYDHYIEIAYWDDKHDGGWWINAFAPPSNKDPTHWMPLPESPK
jgi:hypothetical protein